MGGYTKNVAIIKGLKEGFSADGGDLSGLVRAEKYGARLKVEISLINFAPLTEGRYVAAITDGVGVEIIEDLLFEGDSAVDTGEGFAAVVCYVHGNVSLIASAICGNYSADTLVLRDAVSRLEGAKPKDSKGSIKKEAFVYEDEAIAEVNYYELAKADKDGESVLENPKKEKDGDIARKDEKAVGAVEEGPRRLRRAEGNFYERMKGEIEGLLSSYPAEERLNSAVEGGSFVKISYDKGKYYVFGIIRDNGRPAYICYGVPATDHRSPPDSMQNLATLLCVEGNVGYWVMYQDASTGESIKMT